METSLSIILTIDFIYALWIISPLDYHMVAEDMIQGPIS